MAMERDAVADWCGARLKRNNWFRPALVFHHVEETSMKTGTIALATVVALSGLLALSPAQAKHRHHHHKHHMTTGMGASGSGPSLDGGGVDKSRAGARGVSRKAPD